MLPQLSIDGTKTTACGLCVMGVTQIRVRAFERRSERKLSHQPFMERDVEIYSDLLSVCSGRRSCSPVLCNSSGKVFNMASEGIALSLAPNS